MFYIVLMKKEGEEKEEHFHTAVVATDRTIAEDMAHDNIEGTTVTVHKVKNLTVELVSSQCD